MFSSGIVRFEVRIPFKQIIQPTAEIYFQPMSRICFPQIPWLEQHDAITEFAQSRMAEITRHTNVAKDKQELFVAMCNAVPFYLPAR